MNRKSQGPGGGFIEPGAKRLYRLMVPSQMHPVGEQYYYLSEVQVKPIRDPGEAQVAEAAGGEKRPQLASRGLGTSKPRARAAPGGGVIKVRITSGSKKWSAAFRVQAR